MLPRSDSEEHPISRTRVQQPNFPGHQCCCFPEEGTKHTNVIYETSSITRRFFLHFPPFPPLLLDSPVYFTCASHLHSWNPFATNWCFLRFIPQLLHVWRPGRSPTFAKIGLQIFKFAQVAKRRLAVGGEVPGSASRACMSALGRSCASRRELHIFGHTMSGLDPPFQHEFTTVTLPHHPSRGTAIGSFLLYRHKPL